MKREQIIIDESVADLETANNLKGFIFPVE